MDVIKIHEEDAFGDDVEALLDSLVPGDRLRLHRWNVSLNEAAAHFIITSNTDSGDFHTFGVTYVAGNGALAGGDNTNIDIEFKGAQGLQGFQGNQGFQGVAGVGGGGQPWWWS